MPSLIEVWGTDSVKECLGQEVLPDGYDSVLQLTDRHDSKQPITVYTEEEKQLQNRSDKDST